MKRFKRNVLIISTLSSLVCFLVIFAISILFIRGKQRIDLDVSNTSTYKIFERNYWTNSSSFGLVSLPKIMGGNIEIKGFDSFEDRRSSVIISKFGSTEFECFGSCICDNDRRYTSTFLIRGVSYFLAAVSSIVAYKKAEEYFDSKCQEKYAGKCDAESIRTEISGCEELVSNLDELEDQQRKYFCYGNCVPNLNMKRKDSRKMSNDFGCEKLKQEGMVDVFKSDILIKTKTMGDASKYLTTARLKFRETRMLKFCRENSQINYDVLVKTQKLKEDGYYEYIETRSGTACVAVKNAGRKRSVTNLSNVFCRQTLPESKERNRAWRDRTWWDKKKEWDEL